MIYETADFGPIHLMLSAIDKDSPNIARAMQRLAVAATHCKFVASDSVSDEIVLLKILQVLHIALTSGPGDYLSDESVCSMIETGLSMCFQLQLSGRTFICQACFLLLLYANVFFFNTVHIPLTCTAYRDVTKVCRAHHVSYHKSHVRKVRRQTIAPRQ